MCVCVYARECQPANIGCAEIFDACHFMASFDAKALISFRLSLYLSVCVVTFFGGDCLSFFGTVRRSFSATEFVSLLLCSFATSYRIKSIRCMSSYNQMIFFLQLGAAWDRWFNKIVIILITCVNGCHIVSLFCHSPTHTRSQTDKLTLARMHTLTLVLASYKC